MLRIKVRKGFYPEVFALVLPIILQNLISTAVGTADVVMLGMVGQTALSASSLAGQVAFILSIFFFGMQSAITILAAQYWGKGDRSTVSKIYGLALLISVPLSAAAMLLALFCPGFLMSIWTNDAELIAEGMHYLRFVALSYLFMGISQMYLSVMKSCERVLLSTLVSGSTLLLNILLNAVLIFGLFGAPVMGIRGAALATSIARGLELLICVLDMLRQKLLPMHPRIIFRIPKTLVLDFIRYSVPALVNDIAWGVAYSMYSVIMGHLGSDIVAANSVVTVCRNLCTTIGFSLSAASSILIGKELGENNIEQAGNDADAILMLSFLSSAATGLILFLVSPVIPDLTRLTETARGYLRIMLYINVFYQIPQVVNTVIISSLFRAGGDSRYGMILDILSMWAYAVPLGLISAFVLKLPPIWVYFLLCTDEYVKLLPEFIHYRSGRWLRNLTR